MPSTKELLEDLAKEAIVASDAAVYRPYVEHFFSSRTARQLFEG